AAAARRRDRRLGPARRRAPADLRRGRDDDGRHLAPIIRSRRRGGARLAAQPLKEDPTIIEVGGARPYPVLVGRGLFGRLPEALGPDVANVLIIHPPTLGPVAAAMRASLTAATDLEVLLAEIPDAEAAKRVEVAAFCWEVLGKSDFTRTDAII